MRIKNMLENGAKITSNNVKLSPIPQKLPPHPNKRLGGTIFSTTSSQQSQIFKKPIKIKDQRLAISEFNTHFN